MIHLQALPDCVASVSPHFCKPSRSVFQVHGLCLTLSGAVPRVCASRFYGAVNWPVSRGLVGPVRDAGPRQTRRPPGIGGRDPGPRDASRGELVYTRRCRGEES